MCVGLKPVAPDKPARSNSICDLSSYVRILEMPPCSGERARIMRAVSSCASIAPKVAVIASMTSAAGFCRKFPRRLDTRIAVRLAGMTDRHFQV